MVVVRRQGSSSAVLWNGAGCKHKPRSKPIEAQEPALPLKSTGLGCALLFGSLWLPASLWPHKLYLDKSAPLAAVHHCSLWILGKMVARDFIGWNMSHNSKILYLLFQVSEQIQSPLGASQRITPGISSPSPAPSCSLLPPLKKKKKKISVHGRFSKSALQSSCFCLLAA